MRWSIVFVAVLLAGCSQSSEPTDEPLDAADDAPAEAADPAEPAFTYLNDTAQSGQTMGVDGVLLLTRGPADPATVPARVYEISMDGDLIDGKAVLEWGATAHTGGMIMRLMHNGTELEVVSGTDDLEMSLPAGALDGAYFEIAPDGAADVGGAVQVTYTFTIESMWL